MEWFEKSRERWHQEQEIAARFLTEVEADFDAQERASIVGNFHLVSQHGHEYDVYRIRIVYPVHFPLRGRGPSVYLLSHRGRWKNGGESHIEDDWRLCLFVPGESEIDFARSDSLTELFAVLTTFLRKERIYQRDLSREMLTGKKAVWPGEARDHGIKGIREAIRDRRGISRNEPCLCGSGKKFKRCCMDSI